ncbi:helix-turn-helix domain-containing protein [Cellulosilyticum sp. WCF-2]|uniref:helix-turn-helix domain-containing protein n=1 Tax=Cellulosilyticum sp. WCF-2 TaxID=2497860 RepID=UPI000F8C6FB6|nr:helix-turn-helix transcriptional regulator [Cellulosilyticum sp. WCF-2]QEH68613.1 helix-turn-helix transcriptional regulator [Cellulosilyticum sp. WCF-2]
MNKFYSVLKELREEHSYTQSALADLLTKKGIKTSTQNISYWENGREPNFDTLIALGEIFDVSLDYLLGVSKFKNYKTKSKLEEACKNDSYLLDCAMVLYKFENLFSNDEIGKHMLDKVNCNVMYIYLYYNDLYQDLINMVDRLKSCTDDEEINIVTDTTAFNKSKESLSNLVYNLHNAHIFTSSIFSDLMLNSDLVSSNNTIIK